MLILGIWNTFPPSKGEYFTADTAWCINDEHWWQLLTHICHHYVNCHLPEMGTVRIKAEDLSWISTAGLGWALAELERSSGHRCSFFFLWLAFRQNWCTLAGQFACLASGAVLPNEHSAVKNKADDLNCFKHCHWPWWPLYHVHCVRQCYIWEKRWVTCLLLFQQYSSKILKISNESILWPE